MLITTVLATILITGCGKSETTKNDEKETATETTKEAKEAKAEPKTKSNNDASKIISYIEKETEGTTKILYENNEPQVHQLDDISVSLDSYQLFELNDFHTNFSIPFDNQTDGGVILAKYTIKNDSDKDAYYPPHFYLSFTGAQRSYNHYRNLVPDQDDLTEKLAPKNDYLVKSGESITGYYAYPFSKDDLEKILSLSVVSVEVNEAFSKKEDFSSRIGTKGNFNLSLNKEGAEKVANNATFYEDKVTFNNMGDKKMLREGKDLNQKETIGDFDITFEGFQFTEFTPNSEEAPRFRNFNNGIVLLTVKFTVDNKSSENIGPFAIGSKLTMNNDSQYTLNEGMLEHNPPNSEIKAGESGELIKVFTLDQEQYEKILKDKPFSIELGPMLNEEARDISKGKKANFVLPENE